MPRFLLTALMFCLLGTAHAAQDPAATRAQIEAARQDIAELQKVLKQIREEKTGLERQLKSTETEIGELEKEIDALQQQIRDSERELRQLDEEKTTLEGARREQQRLIAQQARATYLSGRQEYVKLLLNQQHPEKFSRTVTYYEYLSRARFEQIDTFNRTLAQLRQVEADIADGRAALESQRRSLAERHTALTAARQERRANLTALDRQYASREQKLAERQQDRQQLERVLKTIEETLARQAREAEEARQRALAAAREAQLRQTQSQPSAPQVLAGAPVAGPFLQAKGRLPWPVDGRLVARYGAPRHGDARATWDGVLIGAPAGATVRAVHGGRVVFADWLRGAGLLVIVDHGQGYLSLYGHNQSLLRNAGDLVRAGEPIATVGNSGGQDDPALYFAIRQNGRPSDPAQWCRAQG